MPIFQAIQANTAIKEIIKSAFDTELPLDGAWGYSQEEATIIENSDLSLVQTEHIVASMRAFLEMNITRPKEERYGSINLTESSREEINKDSKVYHKVHYSLTAMYEKHYHAFISEYKENYGKSDFDMSAHFKQRKEATLHREVNHWFEISSL